MRHSTLALVCVAVAVALAVASGAVVAQEGDQEQPQADEPEDQPETYEIAIDDRVRVVSSEWDGGTVTVVLEADEFTQVTITDASQRLEGAVDIKRQTVRVPGGERVETTFTVADNDRPAVTVSTRNGIVGLGARGGVSLFAGESASWAEVRAGAIGGILAGITAGGLLAWFHVSRDPEEPVEVIA